jgi:iron complex outermembrane receptor protein
VVRGFDGDRVLVLQDGIPSGTLSSQSGDHGEPVDASAIERVEVVRGPATLLYGSNAIGGVVNVITQHHILEQHPHAGLHGHLSGVTGSANAQAGGSGGFEYGAGDWLLYGGGGGTRMGDYSTPLGKVENSFNYGRQTNLGGGHYSERFSFNLNYLLQDGRYGVPPAEDEHAAGDHPEDELVAIGWRRHNVRFSGAVRELNRALEQFQFSANYSDWNHRELHGDEVGTAFSNRQFSTRGTFTQRRQGPLSGNFGFWTLARDYKAVGEEALAPPAKQNGIAGFALEELSFERVKFQFGGRLEHNRYSPSGLRERSFTGASASAGVQAPLWRGGSAVFNYMHSYRAPALEELYNYGPHPGNNYYEIGNPNLKRELGNGVEVSLRHRSERMRFSANLFRYQMRDFVYFHTTGEEDHGLPVAHSAQADARFLGAESRLEGKLRDGLWLLLGFDAVDAQLTAARAPLPRIPPLRGRAGFDWRRGNLSVRPELVMSNRQWQLAPTETPTAGYAVANLNASYTLTGQHLMHMFQVNCFNLSNRLYRNHLSFIKEFAPEIGRGVRFSYSIQWF